MRRARDRHPHLVWKDRTELRTGELTFGCVACGDEISIVLPCSLSMPSAVGRQWTKEHRDCPEWQGRWRAKLLGVLLEVVSRECDG